MRGRRILILRAAEAATMFALCAALPIPVASIAGADPGGPDRASGAQHRAGSSKAHAADPAGSSSVGIRVLPASPTASPIPHPTPGPGQHGELPFPGSGGQHGQPPFTGSGGQHDVSVDVKSDQSGHSTSGGGSHGHGHGHGHGVPPISRPHPHGNPHGTRPNAPHHGNLPFTGHNSVVVILGGLAAVLTGGVLVWWASVRRKRLARRL
jgi:hypothetical protein